MCETAFHFQVQHATIAAVWRNNRNFLVGVSEMAKRGTSPSVARTAAKVLENPSSGKSSRTAAGSALTQSKAPSERTSAHAASAASQVLRDGRTSDASKTAAGSALSQRKK